MKNFILKAFVLVLMAGFFHACNETYDPPIDPVDSHLKSGLNTAIEKLQEVMDLQDKVTDALFNNPEVVGTGTGLDANGNPTIVVYTISQVQQRADVNIKNIGRGAHPTALPVSIENVPVVPKVTGMFKAYADPIARFARPVPIGVSTGHPDITAGTIGCRVKDSQGNVYALSNNHVYANSNKATLGDNVLQPGPYDGGKDPADAIGTLYDFEPISFSNNNYMDAAIAISSTGDLGTATPNGAYGTPNSTTVSASIGQNVQKYGRTTSLTKGEIAEINVTVDVCYETAGPFRCKSSARFINQISITPGTFSGGGDSGSLIVTDDDSKNPVGLLFAGSTTRTIASPIGVVLTRFGVTIDDGSGGTPNIPPTADFSYSATDLSVSFTDQSSDSDGSIVSWSWDFKDGSTSDDQNPIHIYASGGTYSVTLTVTDDDGASNSVSNDVTVTEPSSGGITLSASGYKVRGRQKADLTWSDASGIDVEIFRNGVSIATTANDGAFTDNIDNVGGGSYTYQVCEAGTSTCSNEVTVTF